MKFKDYLIKNRETAQLIYGLTLIVLIPLLIAFNTVFIIKKYNQSLDTSLQRQALSVGRSISTLIEHDLPWADFIQAKLEALMQANIDIMELTVLQPEGDNFKVIASSEDQEIGAIKESPYYSLAYSQPLNNGLAADSRSLSQDSNYNEFAEAGSEAERFWLVAMPMRDSNGGRQALLTVKLSSRIVDELTGYNRNLSIYLLIGTVLAVIMFLLVAVRMWDYVFLYQKIKTVDRMKDEFISMTSHELRAPVDGLRGHISLILDGTLGEINDKIRHSLGAAQGAAERLSVLIEDLLNVSRIEQGRVKMNFQPTNINKIIISTMAELQLEADSKQLVFNYEPAKDLPRINIDSSRFKQVLINLIGNALKYTPQGGIEIVTEAKHYGEILELRVKDTGLGMTGEEQARLFEKFYRVKNEETKKIAGTGLGLWITRQLVELMHGTIAIESIKNVGTQVTLQFPVVKK